MSTISSEPVQYSERTAWPPGSSKCPIPLTAGIAEPAVCKLPHNEPQQWHTRPRVAERFRRLSSETHRPETRPTDCVAIISLQSLVEQS